MHFSTFKKNFKIAPANSKNLKVFLKTNFQMNSDVFVHTMLHQVVGMDKINTVATGATDRLDPA